MAGFEIHTAIDLHDIQGNVIKGYGRYGFPVARYVLFQLHTEEAGRSFLDKLLPLVTTSAPWTRYGKVAAGTKRPEVTTNVALTYSGLKRVGVPEKSLQTFPDEFSMGMRARTSILGDDGPSAPEHWDSVWQSDGRSQVVDLLVTINANTPENREQRYQEIMAMAAACGDGVEQLTGHRGPDGVELPYQDAGALATPDGQITDREHFGYADGISDPYFKESGSHPDYVSGGGKPVRGQSGNTRAGWEPLATGEFVLGHVDEADEYPAAPIPHELSANGTYLVYRKLHQNVASFDRFVSEQGGAYGDEEEFAAKLVGRWRNGAPLSRFPTKATADAYEAELQGANADRKDKSKTEAERDAAKKRYYELKQHRMAFDYEDDLSGARCPIGSHTRRTNPRGALEFGVDGAFNTPGALVNRRRLVRRGLPYGNSFDRSADDGDHGIIFMAIGASISRQFEFVQQQWVNYGNDFKLASERDPILGNQPESGGTMIFEADPNGDTPPHFCTNIPRFVETRGGDYFFVPSLTALAAIAQGGIDPT